MNNCIFCKIVKGEIPSTKIWEDEKYLAILDINPNTKGMTLVLPKTHHDSYVFKMDDKDYQEYMLSTKKVARMLEAGLKVKRIALVMEGMGINHAHMKLYPMHRLDNIDGDFKEMWHNEKIFFNKYEGYISTQLGPQASKENLEKVAKQIKGAKK